MWTNFNASERATQVAIASSQQGDWCEFHCNYLERSRDFDRDWDMWRDQFALLQSHLLVDFEDTFGTSISPGFISQTSVSCILNAVGEPSSLCSFVIQNFLEDHQDQVYWRLDVYLTNALSERHHLHANKHSLTTARRLILCELGKTYPQQVNDLQSAVTPLESSKDCEVSCKYRCGWCYIAHSQTCTHTHTYISHIDSFTYLVNIRVKTRTSCTSVEVNVIGEMRVFSRWRARQFGKLVTSTLPGPHTVYVSLSYWGLCGI